MTVHLFLQPTYVQPCCLKDQGGSVILRLNGNTWLTSKLLGATFYYDIAAWLPLYSHRSPLDPVEAL